MVFSRSYMGHESSKRMAMPKTGEASKVAVRGDELTTVLDG